MYRIHRSIGIAFGAAACVAVVAPAAAQHRGPAGLAWAQFADKLAPVEPAIPGNGEADGGLAGTLCTQPPGTCQVPGFASGRSAVRALSRRVADDFRTSVSGAIDSICWRGFYGTATCHNTTPDQFEVRYYADAGGVPGAPIGGPFRQSDGTLAGLTRAATGVTIGLVSEFEYVATHNPVNVQAGQCYWFEVTNLGGSPFACNWFWEYAEPVNGRLMYDTNQAYTTDDQVAFDTAWCINLPLADVNACSQAPPNDACENPIEIACGGSATVSNTAATNHPTDPLFACRSGGLGPGTASVWFSFVASHTTAEISTCDSAAPNTIVQVHAGVCGMLTPLACSDDAPGCADGLRGRVCVSGLNVGQRYLIHAASRDDASRGDITVSVRCPCEIRCAEPAANCQPYGLVESVAADLSFRAADDFTLSAAGSVSGVCAWGVYGNNTPNAVDDFDLRYFAHGDGVPGALLAEYRQANGTLTLRARTDTLDDLAGGLDIHEYLFSHAPLALQANTCYWLEIRSRSQPRQWFWVAPPLSAGNGRRAQDRNGNGVFDGPDDRAAGDLAFCLDRALAGGLTACPVAPPTNTHCEAATELTCGAPGVTVIADNIFSGESPNPAMCSGGVAALWYSFLATSDAVRISTCNSFGQGDSVLALYRGACGTLVPLSCVDDSCGTFGELSEIVAGGLMPGERYWIQLAAFAPADRGAYRLELRCEGTTDPCAGELRGDANGDGAINNFDIDAFVLSIADPATYETVFGVTAAVRICRTDITGEGAANNFDIDPFVACLISAPAPGQPCP
ncbi:MAG: hypothetical protein AB7Q17_01210 [Phycisphaerae bacterium]